MAEQLSLWPSSNPKLPDLEHIYLVTAKHCVIKALGMYGNINFRVNVDDGSTRTVPLPSSESEWFFSENSDVAVLRLCQC